MYKHSRTAWEGLGNARAHGRALSRALGCGGVTLVFSLVAFSAKTLALASPTLGAAVQARAIRLWARCIVKLLALRVEARGAPPTAAALLVVNHLSYIGLLNHLWIGPIPAAFTRIKTE